MKMKIQKSAEDEFPGSVGKTQNELFDSENIHTMLFSVVKDALFLIDNENFAIMEANDAACLLYGYSKEEILKLKNYELSAEPEETKRMREELKERVEQRLHKKKDGTIFPVDISSSVFNLKGRKILCAAVRDITRRKEFENLILSRIHLLEFSETHSVDDLLEETLNEGEKLTRSQIAFYHFVDPDQKTVKLQNWSTRTKLEHCTALAKGMSYDTTLAGVWCDCLRERKALIHNDYASLTHKKGFPPGHANVFREMVIPVFRAGNIVALMGVGNKPSDYDGKDIEIVTLLADLAWDIAGRKQAEEVLKLSEARFKTMFNESPFGIALIDSLSGQVYSVNPMFAKIAGRKMEEMAFIDWMSITHPDDIQKDLDHMALLNAGLLSGYQMEKRYLHPDGTPVWINMTIAPFRFEDKAHPRHLCMIEDITNRKIIEQEIQIRNEELLKLNIEKDKFFSIVAHDLRGPFSGLLGLTEVLADRLSNITADEIQQMAFLMRQSATNLFNLLGNLLEWSRMQRGLLPFKPVSFRLVTKISESLLLVLNMAEKKRISIKYDFSDDLIVFADENMFDGIMRNLVSNAVKFSHAGEDITVKAILVPDKWLEISIIDHGIGMDKGIMDSLFRIDVKSNRLGTEGEYSTGLGLILCKDFIEKHGGELTVQSQIGKGSIFSFTLPLESKNRIVN